MMNNNTLDGKVAVVTGAGAAVWAMAGLASAVQSNAAAKIRFMKTP